MVFIDAPLNLRDNSPDRTLATQLLLKVIQSNAIPKRRDLAEDGAIKVVRCMARDARRWT